MKQLKHLPLADVKVTGGFWKEKQDTVSDVTLYSVRDRFRDTGRFTAFEFGYKDGDKIQPHIFWDSDIAKWIESVAYSLLYHPDEELEADVDEVVDLIEKNQCEDGYFNIYFSVVEPGKRFTKRGEHELYCCGHLVEAAIAYDMATGKHKFLDCMCKYVDLIDRVFRVEQSAAFVTPGHPEIELALIRLYRYTGNEKYLKLSEFFINERGTGKENVPYVDWALPNYAQDHAPLREQSTAEGHAVRAAYLYSGMADVAYETKDNELFEACKRIFSNIVDKRMYVTGATGSSHIGEAFTVDYDLQNETAYAETCSALALAWFADRMTALEPNGRYADIVELELYNGGLSGISLDGKSFFYENPLSIDPKLRSRDASVKENTYLPITQRLEVFSCSCCPPNVSRFIASVQQFIYQYDEDTLYVNQYIESDTLTKINGETVSILQQTRYPANGKVSLQLVSQALKRIALRIPGWCRKYTVNLNGVEMHPEAVNGYAYLDIEPGVNEIEILFAVYPRLVAANPSVQDDANKAALMMGPVVYCLEGIDNGINLHSLSVDPQSKFAPSFEQNYGLNTITAKGWRIVRPVNDALYYDYDQIQYVPQTLHFIPYYAFANRGESEMIVWVNVKN